MDKLQDQTVGQMVAEDYRKAEVFKEFGIDFCCGGGVALNKICTKKGIDLAEIEGALKALDNQPTNGSGDYNSWDLDFLADYIVNVHHKYVQKALPTLDQYSEKVARVHGAVHPELIDILEHYSAVAAELRMHMQKEEMVLFPYIRQMMVSREKGEKLVSAPFGSIKNPVAMMEEEHESAGDAMKMIRELSDNFTPPANACNTYRVFFAKLQEFEADLHQHVHLENNILFPKAIVLEEIMLA